jgi:hypothetical protein
MQANERSLYGFLIGALLYLIICRSQRRVSSVCPDEVITPYAPLDIRTLQGVYWVLVMPGATGTALCKEDINRHLAAKTGILSDLFVIKMVASISASVMTVISLVTHHAHPS